MALLECSSRIYFNTWLASQYCIWPCIFFNKYYRDRSLSLSLCLPFSSIYDNLLYFFQLNTQFVHQVDRFVIDFFFFVFFLWVRLTACVSCTVWVLHLARSFAWRNQYHYEFYYVCACFGYAHRSSIDRWTLTYPFTRSGQFTVYIKHIFCLQFKAFT